MTGFRDGSIKVWSLIDFSLLHTFPGHNGSVTCLQFDEEKLISGSNDKSLIIRNSETGNAIKIISHTQAIAKLKFDRNILISCSKDSLLIYNIRDLKNVTFIKDLILNEPSLNNIQFTCNAVDFNDSYLIVGLSRNVGLWRKNENFSFLKLLGSHDKEITSILAYDDNFVISGSNDKTVRII